MDKLEQSSARLPDRMSLNSQDCTTDYIVSLQHELDELLARAASSSTYKLKRAFRTQLMYPRGQEGKKRNIHLGALEELVLVSKISLQCLRDVFPHGNGSLLAEHSVARLAASSLGHSSS